MLDPLLKNESSGRKSHCAAGAMIVFAFFLFLFIAEGWKINKSRSSLADFSLAEIEELVGTSNEMDNMISFSKEIPVGAEINDQEIPVGTKRLANLGTVEEDACAYAGQDASKTSAEIKVKDYAPTAVIPASKDDLPADFVEKQTVGDEWLKTFLDGVLQGALKQNGNLAGCIVSMGPMKEKDRVFEKAKNDYGGDIMKVMDLSRATIVCQNLVYLKTALEVMNNNLCNNGCEDDNPNAKAYLIRIKNKGFDLEKFPEGFTMTKMADITCNIHPPNTPYAVEVQFAILPILLKKANLHGIYDKFRAIESPTPTQCYDFMKESQDVMTNTWQKAVVDNAADMKTLTEYLASLAGENVNEFLFTNLQKQFPGAERQKIESLLQENNNPDDVRPVVRELKKLYPRNRAE